MFLLASSAQEPAGLRDPEISNADVAKVRQQLQELLQQIGEVKLLSDFEVPPEFDPNRPATRSLRSADPPVRALPAQVANDSSGEQSSPEAELHRRNRQIALEMAQLELEERELEVLYRRAELKRRRQQILNYEADSHAASGPTVRSTIPGNESPSREAGPSDIARAPRFVAVPLGDRNAVLVDALTGHTWWLSPDGDRWHPIQRETAPVAQSD
jgi:hypothetical protein